MLFKFVKYSIDFFHNQPYTLCKAFDRGSLFIPPVFYFSFEILKVNWDWFPVFGPSHSNFLNFLFCAICMFPVKICPWSVSVNGGVLQLQGKSFIFSKISLVSYAFLSYFLLNILDCSLLLNVYIVFAES